MANARITKARLQALASGAAPAAARVTKARLQVLSGPSTPIRATRARLQVLAKDPTAGIGSGGGYPAGANPAAGTLPANAALKFIELVIDGVNYPMAAETWLTDPPTWYGGAKAPRLLSVSPIRRRLSQNGAPEAMEFTVIVADTDRLLADLSLTTPIKGAYCAAYVVDDATRRAGGVPFRVAGGKVKRHRPLPGYRYELVVQDVLSFHLAEVWNKPAIPNKVITAAEFPPLDQKIADKALPLIVGEASDESEASPEGVARGFYLGTVNLTAFGGVNVDADAIVFCAHAVGGLQALFYNPPVWGDAEAVAAGQLTRPSTANGYIYVSSSAGTTGGSEPTWPLTIGGTVVDNGITWTNAGAWDNGTRFRVPSWAYGTVLAAPFTPAWAYTGLTTNYLPYGGHYYTLIFWDHNHPAARAIREGRIEITGNFVGMTDNSGGTGNLIDSPEDLIIQLVACYVENRWTSGPWPTLPQINGYDIFDMTTRDAAKAVSAGLVTGGYVIGGCIAADGQQRTAVDVIAEILKQTNGRIGVNRHGQIVFNRRSTAAAATVTLREGRHIIEDSFTPSIEDELFANRITVRAAPRVPASNAETGTKGAPMPADTEQRTRWRYLPAAIEDTASQAAVGLKEEIIELPLVRRTAVADSIGSELAAWRLGPAAAGDGARTFTVQGEWDILAGGVDLGTVANVVHGEAPVIGGGAVKAGVIGVEIDLLADLATLEFEYLADAPGITASE